MTFFGLTHLGFEDPLRDYVIRKDLLPDPDFRPSVLREHPYEQIKNHYFYSKEFKYDRPWYWNGVRKPPSHRKPPFTLYREPLTTNELYGWWIKDLPAGQLLPPWAFVKRYPAIHSDITKYYNH